MVVDIPVALDLLLDSLAIISIFITLYVLRTIIKVLSKAKAKPIYYEDILEYIQKTNIETLNAIKMSLEILQQHVEKIDHIVDNQSKLILKQEEVINRQEEIIGILKQPKQQDNEQQYNEQQPKQDNEQKG